MLSRSNLKHVSVMRIPNNHPDKSIKAATSNSLSSTRIRILKKKNKLLSKLSKFFPSKHWRRPRISPKGLTLDLRKTLTFISPNDPLFR